MEKVIYSLWRRGADADQYAAELREELVPALLQNGALGLQLNFRDAAARPAAGVEILNYQPPADAVIQLWVHSAIPQHLQVIDELLRQSSHRHAGWLVTEAFPHRNTEFPPTLGERTAGMSQVVFMERPPRYTPEAWIDYWHSHHTGYAMEAQNHISYCQNVVRRPVTFGAPPYDAIVEACFGPRVLDDLRYRFKGGSLKEREETAASYGEKTVKMVDFDRIDVIATSQYLYRYPGWSLPASS